MWIFLTIFFFVLFLIALGYALIEREGRIRKEKELMQLTIKMRDILRKRTMTRESVEKEEEMEEDAGEMDFGPVIYRTINPSAPSIPIPPQIVQQSQNSGQEAAYVPQETSPAKQFSEPAKENPTFSSGLLFPEEYEPVLFPSMADGPREKRRLSARYGTIDHAFVEKARTIVSEHMSDASFGVEELSGIMGMSRVHLARKFKENTDMTPNALIRNTRIDEATRLLIEGQSSMHEIAQRCGFASASYFSTSFKSVYGITPKEFVAQFTGLSLEEALKKKIQQP